jgi:hypothetical protein
MEDVLDVYHAPYNPQFPLVCMDESNKQLVGEVHAPLAAAPGHGQINDHEYVRNGVAEIFLEVEPLRGRRHVAITEHRTRKDWALFVKGMLDERYPQATKVRLVMDNWNTHSAASLYEAFEPEEARRLARRLDIHYAIHPRTKGGPLRHGWELVFVDYGTDQSSGGHLVPRSAPRASLGFWRDDSRFIQCNPGMESQSKHQHHRLPHLLRFDQWKLYEQCHGGKCDDQYGLRLGERRHLLLRS